MHIFRIAAIGLIFFIRSAVSVLDENTLEKIFKEHCSELKNTDIKLDPFVISFSGTPGMGKSFIAKKLEDIYKAVRISTDELRNLLESYFIDKKNRESVVEEYLSYFLQNYKLPNKFIILDASIDRRYKQLFPYLKTKKIKFVVIRLQVPKDTIIERIKERDSSRAEWFLKNLDHWLQDYLEFANQFKEYISFDNEDNVSLDNLIVEINKFK